MTKPPTFPVEIPAVYYVVADLLAKARGQSLEDLVAGLLAQEIPASREEIDAFTDQVLAGEEPGLTVERIRGEDGGET